MIELYLIKELLRIVRASKLIERGLHVSELYLIRELIRLVTASKLNQRALHVS